jgi:hypothetical protein
MQQDKSPIYILLVAAIGAMPSLLTLLISSLRERRLIQKREQSLEHATKIVSFLEAWLKTQESVQLPEEFKNTKIAIQQKLDGLLNSLSSEAILDLPPSSQSSTYSTTRNIGTIRELLLLYRPSSMGGWIIHILFYLNLILAISLNILYLYLIITDPFFRQIVIRENAWQIILIEIIVFVPLIIWHVIAIRIHLRSVQYNTKA